VFSRSRGVVLSLTRGHNGDQNGDQLDPRWRHFCLHISITIYLGKPMGWKFSLLRNFNYCYFQCRYKIYALTWWILICVSSLIYLFNAINHFY
jgi:hypothetical protein